MNRKKKSKLAKVVPALHPYDDVECWLRNDFREPPVFNIAEFQKKLDSAFGAENAFVLAWSGDRTYGDAFLNEKGELERKPVLLLAQEQVNATDYIYISVPRWVIMEVLHGSQLEQSWEAASFINDDSGIPRRVRAQKPPQYFYKHFRTIAQHNPWCCDYMLARNAVCYGKYRLPSEEDVKVIRGLRVAMDEKGVAQRNDAPRDAKVLQLAADATRHHMKYAAQQRKKAVQELIMSDPMQWVGDILKTYNITQTAPEIDRTLKEGFAREEI